jgi:hypothetical protein
MVSLLMLRHEIHAYYNPMFAERGVLLVSSEVNQDL